MKLFLLLSLLLQDTSQSLEEKIRHLEEKIKKEDTRVNITKTNAKIEDIIEEFKKQVQINIIANLERVPESYRIPEFSVEDVPFKEAWEHFLELASLTIINETANVIVVERPAILEAVSFRDSDIKTVIETLAKISGVNIVVSPGIQGTISLTMTDVPWFAVLESVVKTLGFSTVREQYGIIRIVTTAELYQQLETRMFSLKYLKPPVPYRPKKEDDPYIKSKDPEVASSYDDIIAQFSFLRLVESMLSKDAAGSSIGSFNYDPQTNSLVVKDIKPVLDDIAIMIKKLDVEPLQVALDVTFVKTKNEDLLTFGIDYFGGASATPGFQLATGTRSSLAEPPDDGMEANIISKFPFGITNVDPEVSPFFFFTNYENQAVLNLFKKDAYTKLEQKPNIHVMDGNEATIFVGEQVPYAVANIIVEPGQPPQATLVEGDKSPVQIGFQLLVQPRILSEEGKVNLLIIPKNVILTGSDNAQPGFERFTLNAFGSQLELVLPRLGETALMTQLLIEDGQTAIIGGLVVNSITNEDRGLPFLKDIPIIGYAFKRREDAKVNEYLLIFITPRIVRNTEDVARAINAKVKKRHYELIEELKRLKSKENK